MSEQLNVSLAKQYIDVRIGSDGLRAAARNTLISDYIAEEDTKTFLAMFLLRLMTEAGLLFKVYPEGEIKLVGELPPAKA